MKMKIAKLFAITFTLATVMTTCNAGTSEENSNEPSNTLEDYYKELFSNPSEDKAIGEAVAGTFEKIISDKEIAQQMVQGNLTYTVCSNLLACMRKTGTEILNEILVDEPQISESNTAQETVVRKIKEVQTTVDKIETQEGVNNWLMVEGLVEHGKITVWDFRKHAIAVVAQIEIFVNSDAFKNAVSTNLPELIKNIFIYMNLPNDRVMRITDCSIGDFQKQLMFRLFDEDIVTAVLRERLIRVSESGETFKMEGKVYNFDRHLMSVSHDIKEYTQSWTGPRINEGVNFCYLCFAEQEFFEKKVIGVELKAVSDLKNNANENTRAIIYERYRDITPAKELFSAIARDENIEEKIREAAKRAEEDVIYKMDMGIDIKTLMSEVLGSILMDKGIATIIAKDSLLQDEVCFHLNECLKSTLKTVTSDYAGYTKIVVDQDAKISEGSEAAAPANDDFCAEYSIDNDAIRDKLKEQGIEVEVEDEDAKVSEGGETAAPANNDFCAEYAIDNAIRDNLEEQGIKVEVENVKSSSEEVCKQLMAFTSSETFKESVKANWQPSILENVLFRVNKMILIHRESQLEGWEKYLTRLSSRVENIIPEELAGQIADVCLSHNNAQENIKEALFHKEVVKEVVIQRLKREKTGNGENIETLEQVCNLDTYLSFMFPKQEESSLTEEEKESSLTEKQKQSSSTKKAKKCRLKRLRSIFCLK